MDTTSRDLAADEPVVEFWARIKGRDVLVRVMRKRIEWSFAGRDSVVELIPMATVTSVGTMAARTRSVLMVTTDGRTIEFRVDAAVAEELRMLIRLLMTVYGQPLGPPRRDPLNAADELNDLGNRAYEANMLALTNDQSPPFSDAEVEALRLADDIAGVRARSAAPSVCRRTGS